MQYLARITIHNGTYLEYEALHQRMHAIGFVRVIRAANGVRYSLPDATYVGERFEAVAAVQQLVANQAKQAAPMRGTPQVFVCDYNLAAWSGLPVAK
ncbi:MULTISPECIES: hypothetical protein [Cupriavidus]|uniref:DUF2622 domain-containing protein n=1 Tax=Cupriavidus pauculus TaxID=82633 RepID=A0A5P2H1M1_9BURK|nr:hypothetical protein [Cupriavidus pauculus]QET01654.1 hypothetical protein FOB72_06100 [Cupriavidus pauculus]